MAHGVLQHLDLVLDLDGTLVSIQTPTPLRADESRSVCEDVVVLPDGSTVRTRPYARAFLRFAFAAFRSVSFWTASVAPRAAAIVRALVPKGRVPAGVWSRETCDVGDHHGTGVWSTRKRLDVLLCQPGARAVGMSPASVLHVDDDVFACVDHAANLVPVSTYVAAHDPQNKDAVLDHLARALLSLKPATAAPMTSLDARSLNPLAWRSWRALSKQALQSRLLTCKLVVANQPAEDIAHAHAHVHAHELEHDVSPDAECSNRSDASVCRAANSAGRKRVRVCRSELSDGDVSALPLHRSVHREQHIEVS
jgi:hypothetical protein